GLSCRSNCLHYQQMVLARQSILRKNRLPNCMKPGIHLHFLEGWPFGLELKMMPLRQNHPLPPHRLLPLGWCLIPCNLWYSLTSREGCSIIFRLVYSMILMSSFRFSCLLKGYFKV